MRARRILFGVSLALILFLALDARPAPALERSVAQRVMKSVVQIIAAREKKSGVLVPQWGGSGTIISADGLILTNCHVALPKAMWDEPRFDYDLLVVALTVRSDEPPRPTYLAEVVQYDPDLDLAVIRVSQMLDGSAVDRAKLNLPALALGDSDTLDLGDRLSIFGYPGIGGETITFTSGDVSGFTREEGVEGRAWIKTDATIAGGNSGGTAVNEQGELVGIPTQSGAGGDAQYVDCRHLADTNGDGVIDENDSCIPIGGFINALRPVNLAKPLIEAARRGLVRPFSPSPAPKIKPATEPPAVSRLIFAPAINQADQPVTVADSLPSGIGELYFFFDYRGFRDGVAWQPVLVRNGQALSDTWPSAPWSGGPQGMWWVGLSDAAFPDGTYEIRIHYGGKTLGSATAKVGGPASTQPTFSNLTLATGEKVGAAGSPPNADGSPPGAEGRPPQMPAGGSELRAAFDYAHMTADTSWSYRLYREGKEEEHGDGQPPLEGSGKGTLLLRRSPAFGAGNYRLELYVAKRLSATADFTLVGGPRTLFGPLTFAEGVDRRGNPVQPGTAFQSGLSELYAFFDYDGMQDGWEWGWQWTINGEALRLQKRTWEDGESGQNELIRIYSDDVLPDGTYQLDLYVKGEKVQSGSCTVGGKAPKPTPTPEPPEGGVEIQGRITDAETKKGIPDALFLVLRPGITVDAFRWKEEQVFAMAETDRRGYFELPEPLQRGERYSWIITARGYKPILEDGVTIAADAPSPYELNVTLQRAK